MAINIYDVAIPAQQHVMNTQLELPFQELNTLGATVQKKADKNLAALEAIKDVTKSWVYSDYDKMLRAPEAINAEYSADIDNYMKKHGNMMSTPEATADIYKLVSKIQNDPRKAVFAASAKGEEDYYKMLSESDKWKKKYNIAEAQHGYAAMSQRGTYKVNPDGTFDWNDKKIYRPTPYTQWADINGTMEQYIDDSKASGYLVENPDGNGYLVKKGEEGQYQKLLEAQLLSGWSDFISTPAFDNLYQKVKYTGDNKNLSEEELFDKVLEEYKDLSHKKSFERAWQKTTLELSADNRREWELAGFEIDEKNKPTLTKETQLMKNELPESLEKVQEKLTGNVTKGDLGLVGKRDIALHTYLTAQKNFESETNPVKKAQYKAEMDAAGIEVDNIDKEITHWQSIRDKYEQKAIVNAVPGFIVDLAERVKAGEDVDPLKEYLTLPQDKKDQAIQFYKDYIYKDNMSKVSKSNSPDNITVPAESLTNNQAEKLLIDILDNPDHMKTATLFQSKMFDIGKEGASEEYRKDYNKSVSYDAVVLNKSDADWLNRGVHGYKIFDSKGEEITALYNDYMAKGFGTDMIQWNTFSTDQAPEGHKMTGQINKGTKQAPVWEPISTTIPSDGKNNFANAYGSVLLSRGIKYNDAAALESANKLLMSEMKRQVTDPRGTNIISVPGTDGKNITPSKPYAVIKEVDRPGSTPVYEMTFYDGQARTFNAGKKDEMTIESLRGTNIDDILVKIQKMSNEEIKQALKNN
jgi:hypothetical protein